jgi:hypothetical protein
MSAWDEHQEDKQWFWKKAERGFTGPGWRSIAAPKSSVVIYKNHIIFLNYISLIVIFGSISAESWLNHKAFHTLVHNQIVYHIFNLLMRHENSGCGAQSDCLSLIQATKREIDHDIVRSHSLFIDH